MACQANCWRCFSCLWPCEDGQTWAAVPLLTIALVVWASLAIMVPLLVQQRFFGIPNRVFMVAYGVWLILAARPLVKAGETMQAPVY